MKVSFESFNDLLRELYSAASDPSRWQSFLECVKAEMGGTACGILVRNDRAGEVGEHAVSIGIQESFVKAYKQYYSSINFVYDAAIALAPNDYVGTLQRAVNVEEYRRSEIYNDYARPQDLFHQCCAILAHKGNYSAAISFMRPEREGEYGDEHVQLLSLLAPHMRQAFQLHNMLRHLEASNDGLSVALDRSETAVFLLDGIGRLQRANEAGYKLLSDGDALVLRNGCLRPWQAADAAGFERLVKLACVTGAGCSGSPGGLMLLHRKEGRPLHCEMVPFHSDSLFHGVDPAGILFVHKPDGKMSSRAPALRALYKLTPTEARLSDLLAHGLELREAADHMHVSFETARSQLKKVLAKTGTNRQTELIRLLLSLPAGTNPQTGI